MKRLAILTILAATMLATTPLHAAKPLKVYILAGQSNMQGHAKVETFDYIGDDPATAPLLKEMRGPDGKPRVCEKVWISYLTGPRDALGEGIGKLTAGYGARKEPAEDGGKIGPEFTFGLTMEKATDGPILIIKTAWGGKSLHTDFRPPSAGPYEFTEAQLENFKKQGKDIEEVKADKVKATGDYYRLMTEHVKKVLADPKRVVPNYDAQAGYELAGFVWFQGFNDGIAQDIYKDCLNREGGGYAEYSRLLAHFISDVRKEFSAPKTPFVIGVKGACGSIEQMAEKDSWKRLRTRNFRAAQAAPANMPEFKGNVAAVQTAPYWDTKLAAIRAKLGDVHWYDKKMRIKHKDSSNKDGTMTREQRQEATAKYRATVITPEDDALWKRGGSDEGFHYLGCAKTFAQIGKAFAEAILKMEKK